MSYETLRPYFLMCLWSFAYWRALSRRAEHANRAAEPDLEGEGALLVWEGEGGSSRRNQLPAGAAGTEVSQ